MMYGSSFCMATEMPRLRSRRPRLEAVSPFPREETTPPVTKMWAGTVVCVALMRPDVLITEGQVIRAAKPA